MSRRKPTSIYRKILASAWYLTWQRKYLWVFGIFAAIISTGGVFEVAFRDLNRIKSGGSLLEQILTGSFTGYQGFAQYIELLQTQNQLRISLTITLFSLLFIILVITTVLSQSALISGLIAKKSKNVREIIIAAWPHFWRILILDVVIKLTSILLLFITTLPLALLLSRGNLFDGILYFVLFLILFPAIIVVNILGTLSLIEIVKRKITVINALHNSWNIFLRHWLAAFELGLILFFIMMAGMIITSASVVFISIPYAALTALAILTATPIIFTLVNIMGGLAIILVIVIAIGAMVTFQHAVWVKFHERAVHRVLGKKTIAKIERFWHHF